ncbi:hypothetical protein ACFVX6_25845 [Streptomyces sp. NPDC058289]|uniref:hypothetical protein n=1 Tax=Streptomyces sp. NPDC058289 TaxID=3346425 RepID=UPI0036EBBF48
MELLLARGQAKAAAAELEAVDRRLTPRGIQNPSRCPRRLHLARAVAAEDPARAREPAEEAVRRARAFGAASGIGQALRVAAEVASPQDRPALLEEAVEVLSASPAAHEPALAPAAPGEERGDAELLLRAVLAARACGADGLVATATTALLARGGALPCGSVPGAAPATTR